MKGTSAEEEGLAVSEVDIPVASEDGGLLIFHHQYCAHKPNRMY